MRVLVAAADVVGERMGGVGIRAWELSRVLAREHEVTLLAPGEAPGPAPVRFVQATRRAAEVEAPAQDVVIAQGAVLRDLPALAQPAVPLVIDLYDPFIVEGLEFRRDGSAGEQVEGWRRDLGVLSWQLAAGDLFLCASQRQRLFCIGLLAAAGRVNPATYAAASDLGGLVRSVPFGIAEDEPAADSQRLPGGLSEEDEIVVWGGGIWNWLDPLVLIRAAAELAPRRPRLRVLFMGSAHPNPSLPQMRIATEARRLSHELGLAGRTVLFADGWVPYAERGAILAAARAGVSLNPPGLEAELAFRTRCLDYLWACLPMVVTAGDSIADLVTARGLGLTTPPGDPAALATALERLLTDAELAAGCRTAARTVREEFRWSRAAEPLLEFCRAPVIAADRELAPHPAGAAEAGLPWRAAARSLRRDGPGRFAARTWRYLRRRWA